MNDSPFRWRAFFQRSQEPLFLLNRQRRLLFGNHAWNQLTGLDAAQFRGRICRRYKHPEPGSWAAVAAALAPPPEVLQGQVGKIRRTFVGHAGRHGWEVDFFPWRDAQGLLGILGKITPLRLPATPTASALLPDKLLDLRLQMSQRYRLEHLTSQLPGLQRVAEQVRLAMQTAAPVVIHGEPGSGKQYLARIIHHHGLQRERTFAAVDCAGLPPAALAASLFGPGGLTRRSSVGTLYLRHPDALPRELQSQLTDWGNEAEAARPRVIAGLTCTAESAIRAGRLLEDFYCTLAVVTMQLPPLRERQADLPMLTDLLLERTHAPGGQRCPGVSAECGDILSRYPWPGNLRELAEVLGAAQTRAAGKLLAPGDLAAHVRRAVQLEEIPARAPARPLPLKQLLEQIERRLITLALQTSRGNKSEAAKMLAIWRPLLLRRMQALGIPDPAPKRKQAPPS